MKHFNIPIFVPHAGCPHDCVFCNQKNITGHLHAQNIASARQTIEEHLESISRYQNDCHVEIAFFGGSFTGIPVEEQVAYLALSKEYLESGLIDGVRLSTRPDYIDTEILNRLEDFGVTVIELGVQSLDYNVITLSNRGHDLTDVIRACGLIRQYDFKLGLQMMIGLPGDSQEKSLRTAKYLCELKPDMVRIYPTIVIEGTVLEYMYHQGQYEPLSLEDAVFWTRDIYKMFTSQDIPVIRMGLQATEALQEAVAGPFHPSFRQLVENAVYFESLGMILKPAKEIIIYVNPREVSNLVGQKRMNLEYYEGLYELSRIKVIAKEMPDSHFLVEIDGQVFKVPKMTIKL